ncbi:hypothetical protein GCM10007209_36280 [Haloferax sulfurifontis]|uniref:Uncharacterized protein n=1 Tax=Haloferax sulfurifontis TaxID=255616 RepID=A0A830DX20_9EURY|nr:hypothetical protein GCM10007209_36280 [Haloferax sulfurifontis]
MWARGGEAVRPSRYVTQPSPRDQRHIDKDLTEYRKSTYVDPNGPTDTTDLSWTEFSSW